MATTATTPEALSGALRRRPGYRLRRPTARTAAIAGAVAVAELVLAGGIVEPRLAKALAAIAALGALAVIARWPAVGTVALLVLVASALDPELIIINIGSFHARGYELALGALLVVAAFAPRRRTWGGAAGACVAAFLALLGIATELAVGSGSVSMSDAVQWSRGFGVIVLFFCVVRLCPDRRTLDRLLTAGAIIGAITGLAALAVAAGVNLDRLFGSSLDTFVDTSQGLGSIPRIRLPGVGLAYVLLWWTVLQALRARSWRRAGWLTVLGGMVACLALSLNRDMWLGAAGGLLLLIPLGGVSLRRSAALAMTAAACGIAVMILLGVGVGQSSPLQPIIQRGSTLLNPTAVSQEDSLQSRARETSKAWQVVKEHPVFGIGPGTPFGVTFNAQVSTDRYAPTPQLFLHNQYLYLLLIGGFPLLLAFLGFLAAVAGRARRLVGDPDGMAILVGMVMLVVSGFVLIAYQDANMMAAFALVAGALVVRSSVPGSTPEPAA